MLNPRDGSWPASAVTETTSASARTHGATAVHAQPNRERPIHNPREVSRQHEIAVAARAGSHAWLKPRLFAQLSKINTAQGSKPSRPTLAARRRRQARQDQFERFDLSRLNIADGLPMARAMRPGMVQTGVRAAGAAFKSWAACKPTPAPVRYRRYSGRNEACGCRTNRRRPLRVDSAGRRPPAQAAP